MTKKLTNNRGFTLIEVVIVLAIAALIILVVLQAVSAAQRSSRDNTRKQEAGQVAAMLEQYASNNRGRYPSSLSGLSDYDNSELVSGNDAKYTVGTCSQSTREPGVFQLEYNLVSSRSYTLNVCLEGTIETSVTD